MGAGTPQRFIPLQCPLNFRDLGSYTTTDGHAIQWRPGTATAVIAAGMNVDR